MTTVKNPLKVFHVRDELYSKAVVTIATKISPDYPNTIKVGFAFCSPKDQFNRKIGRKIAIGRMESFGSNVYSYDTFFGGHSADSIVKLWPSVRKPSYLQNRRFITLAGRSLKLVI